MKQLVALLALLACSATHAGVPAEFNPLVGDYGSGMDYPYYWFIAPTGRQIKQLPRGSGNYTELDQHIQILKTP